MVDNIKKINNCSLYRKISAATLTFMKILPLYENKLILLKNNSYP